MNVPNFIIFKKGVRAPADYIEGKKEKLASFAPSQKWERKQPLKQLHLLCGIVALGMVFFLVVARARDLDVQFPVGNGLSIFVCSMSGRNNCGFDEAFSSYYS